MNAKASLALGAVLTGFSATPQAGAILNFTVIEARWADPSGGNVTYLDPAAGAFGDPARIRWGTQTNSNNALNLDSGYDFDATNTPFSEPPNKIFALGTFTHLNRPIAAGNAISSVDLLLRTSFDYDDGINPVQSFTGVVFEYSFDHNETPNNPPCQFDNTTADVLAVPKENVNSQGCGDIVSITPSVDNFIFDGLTLSILGFSESIVSAKEGTFFDLFLSGEASSNQVVIAATFTAAPVSAPATLALLGAGLLGFGLARRRD
jgi:hypothetical protein